MDVLEIARSIYNLNIKHKPDILMLMSNNTSEQADDLSQFGVRKFLSKPVTKSNLLDAIIDMYSTNNTMISDGNADLKVETYSDIWGSRILLVEDNEINQQVAQEILLQAGLEVHISNNGQEALIALEKDEYDVVLMDQHMPVMDGYRATIEIRNNPRLVQLPIISMTANVMNGERERSLEVGMNDFVAKPVNPEELLEVLHKWIKPGNKSTITAQQFRLDTDDTDFISWPHIPGIELEDGLLRLGSNKNLYIKLLGQFYNGNIGLAESIKAALTDNDNNTAARLVHTAKGVAANLGAVRLATAGNSLEASLKQGKESGIELLLEKFSNELTIVLDGIKMFEDASAAGDSEPAGSSLAYVDMDKVEPLLISLMHLLETGMVDSIEQIDILEEHLRNSKDKLQFGQLKQDVVKFDMDSAMMKLEELAAALEVTL
jgi:two-component system, sensor histidine kinase and response regulator